ncbi:hypothetical protein BWI93_08920 [Siphonobacter sp. BAB-5385]|uniref:hypothetical protein n=1 Tax=Siphonobacter sp. BAB-5385 TaxID=1864822 RepID=UPI000B9DEEBA|nr:hypothetical protein BWI93_08920 [Siphonobacter sp. BAB-5385]
MKQGNGFHSGGKAGNGRVNFSFNRWSFFENSLFLGGNRQCSSPTQEKKNAFDCILKKHLNLSTGGPGAANATIIHKFNYPEGGNTKKPQARVPAVAGENQWAYLTRNFLPMLRLLFRNPFSRFNWDTETPER